jgi:hypothetical protein
MAQNFTQADVNQILNQPGIFKFRKYGTSDSYREAIFTNGASFSYTPTVNTQAFDSTGDVYDYIGEEAGEVTFSYGKPMDLDFMSELSNGLFTKTTTAGGDESFVNQVIAGGTWSDITPVTINLIDSTGKYNVASEAPDIASVTASTAGVLAANTDYALIKDPNSRSGYSIILITAGPAGVTTAEDVTIVYNDSGVVAQTTMTGGGVSNYGAIEGFYETILKDNTPAKVYFHYGFYNGNINLSFGSDNDPVAALTDVTISLKKDPQRAAGAQIFEIVLG